MDKCKKCSARKGKRNCPALKALICPKCCGMYRLGEIPCPPDCVYLGEGEEYQKDRRFRKGIKSGRDYITKRRREFEKASEFELALFIEEFFYQALKRNPQLSHLEILSTIDFVLAKMSPIVRLDLPKTSLGEELLMVMDEFSRRRGQGPFMKKSCLEKLRESVYFLTETKKNPDGYKNFIFPYFNEVAIPQKGEGPSKSSSSIIIP